jgi:hypothetical protein
VKPTCPECDGPAKPADLERHGCCFRCKIGGLGFAFHGGGQMNSRAAFHEHTNREVEREIVDLNRKRGREIQRVGGTYTGPGKL